MHIPSSFLCSAALTALLAGSPLVALARDIVVGQVAPFGGPLAVSGRDFNLGAMIAFDEINAHYWMPSWSMASTCAPSTP